MQNKKLLDKIAKLFAMSNDVSSPNEAATAAKMMRKLMQEHGVKLEDLKTSKFGTATAAIYKKSPYWVVGLTNAAAEVTHTRAVKMKDGTFLFQGLEEDVIVAELTFHYFQSTMQKSLKKETVVGKLLEFNNSFRSSFASELLKRCKAMMKKESNTGSGKELVLTKAGMLDEEFGVLVVKKIRSNMKNMDGAHAGAEAAKKVGLSKQVTEDQTKKVAKKRAAAPKKRIAAKKKHTAKGSDKKTATG